MKISIHNAGGPAGNLKIVQATVKTLRNALFPGFMLFLVSSGCALERPTQNSLYYFPLGADERLYLEYGGYNLLQPQTDGPVTPRDLSVESFHADLRKSGRARTNPTGISALPALIDEAPGVHIQNLPAWYFEREAGLRIRYSSPETSRYRDEIQKLLERIRSGQTKTARGEFQRGRLHLSLISAAALSRQEAPLISLNAHPSRDTLKERGIRGSLLHFTSVRTVETGSGNGEHKLYSRFWGPTFHLLVYADRLCLLGEPAGNRSLLRLCVHSPEAARQTLRGLQKIPDLQEKLNRAAHERKTRVSEVYFHEQGGKDAAFLEVAGDPKRAVRDRIEIRNAGGFLKKYELFLFPGAVRVITADALPPGDEIEFRSENGERESPGEFTLLRPQNHPWRVPSRSFSLRETLLKPEIHCLGLGGPRCSNPGIDPVWLINPAKTEAERPNDCRLEEPVLSEFNPFGFLRKTPTGDVRLDPGGKFLELKLGRKCDSSGLLLQAGSHTLEFPAGSGGPGPLLFVADPEGFRPPKEVPLRIDSGLRGLSVRDSLVLYDPLQEKERELRRSVGPENFYIYGDKQYKPDAPETHRGYKNVYSLTVSSESDETSEAGPREYFHAPRARGLRTDLSSAYAMSPGYLQDASPQEDMRVRLSEVLPQGGRTADGQSVPGDEFLELAYKIPIQNNASLWELEVRETGSGKIRRFRLPSPLSASGQTNGNDAYVTIMGEAPVCFANDETFRPLLYSDFNLPNTAAEYTLRDHRGAIIDSLLLDSRLYKELDGRETRLSYQRIGDEALWRPGDGRAAFENLCEQTGATPGKPSAYRPFIRQTTQEPGPGQTPVLRLYTRESPLSLELTLRGTPGGLPDTSTRQSFVFSRAHREELTPWPGIYNGLSSRYYLELRTTTSEGGPLLPDGAPLYIDVLYRETPLLLIETLAPTPSDGRQEYIRLCSPEGFSAEERTQGLFIKDSRSSDEIVPWSTRFPGTPPPIELERPGSVNDPFALGAGECALVLDPDTAPGSAPRPRERDRQIWTIRQGSAIGNGLASGEGVSLYRLLEPEATPEILSALGRPDSSRPFSLPTSRGESLNRRPGYDNDSPETWEIQDESTSGGSL